MKVTINDTAVETSPDTTLEALLASQGIAANGIAVAINGTVIAKQAYGSTVINEGDSLLIIKAFYGG